MIFCMSLFKTFLPELRRYANSIDSDGQKRWASNREKGAMLAPSSVQVL
jgi:hypothetical protein